MSYSARDAEEVALVVGMTACALLILAMVVVPPILIWRHYRCEARWEWSGMASQYRALSNTCMVETSPGVWIPEDRYLVIH